MKNINEKFLLLLLIVLLTTVSCSHKISPSEPTLPVQDSKIDTLPNLATISSEINIPVQIDLKPLYILAEKNIDSIFNSPGYPDKWVYEGCATRYKYSFRRGPLQMKATGNTLNFGFTGYYKVIGSTRACVNGTPISPWTPPCKCGFSEGERRVSISFSGTFILQPDYKFRLFVNVLEPQAIDKCEVCFWGQDITTQVMREIKINLEDAKKNMEQSYAVTDLRPWFQQLWDQLNENYNIDGLGWLQVHPHQVHINSLYASNDTLNIFMGLSASPVISFEKPVLQKSSIPKISNSATAPGFNIFVDAVLHYDSLGKILNQQVAGLSIELDKGPLKKEFIIDACQLYGAGNEKMIVKVKFGGSAEGTAYFTGKPTYDPFLRIVEIKDLDFDIRTKDKFLKTASWLFNKKITDEISSYTKFDLNPIFDSTRNQLNQQLNSEWIPGVHSFGNITKINLVGIYPSNQFLIIRSNCSGFLSMQVNPAYLKF